MLLALVHLRRICPGLGCATGSFCRRSVKGLQWLWRSKSLDDLGIEKSVQDLHTFGQRPDIQHLCWQRDDADNCGFVPPAKKALTN